MSHRRIGGGSLGGEEGVGVVPNLIRVEYWSIFTWFRIVVG